MIVSITWALGIGTTRSTVSGRLAAVMSAGSFCTPINPVRKPCSAQAMACNSGSVSASASRAQFGVSEIRGCEA